MRNYPLATATAMAMPAPPSRSALGGHGVKIDLGADVLPNGDGSSANRGFVVTRLHARYSKDQVGEDLVFKAAEPIGGGREVYPPSAAGGPPRLETGSTKDGYDNFQGRYAIRHPWTGPIACDGPKRGVWGGPPSRGALGALLAGAFGLFARRRRHRTSSPRKPKETS